MILVALFAVMVTIFFGGAIVDDWLWTLTAAFNPLVITKTHMFVWHLCSNRFLPLGEVVASRAATVIVSASDGPKSPFSNRSKTVVDRRKCQYSTVDNTLAACAIMLGTNSKTNRSNFVKGVNPDRTQYVRSSSGLINIAVMTLFKQSEQLCN